MKMYRDMHQHWQKLRAMVGELLHRFAKPPEECPTCGRWFPKTEFHHIGRGACNDQVIAVCRACHDHLSRSETLDPKIISDPRHPLQKKGRLLLGHAHLHLMTAYLCRQIGLDLIKLAEMHPDLNMPDDG